MLFLTRKYEESILIGDNIVITVLDITGDKVRLGIDAPKDVPVHREEVYQAIHGGPQKTPTNPCYRSKKMRCRRRRKYRMRKAAERRARFVCPICDNTGMIRLDDGDGMGSGPGYDFFGPPCPCGICETA